MTQKVLIQIGVGILVVIGGLVFFGGDKGVDSVVTNTMLVPNNMETVDEMLVQEPGEFSGSFADLSKRGGDWKCEVDHTTVLSDTAGTVYVSDKNIRGEFSVDAPYVGNIEVNMIADGSDVYSWTSMTPQGIKAPQVSLENKNSDTQTSGQVIDSQQVLNYDCQPWEVDSAVFALPQITFTEIGA